MQTFQNMLGRTMVSVVGEKGGDVLRFAADDGSSFVFYHEQDCCEDVSIEDIAGDLSDLVGQPILMAEEVSSDDAPAVDEETESYTWTFYRFGTKRGFVTVRWFGVSNGYYSESVYFEERVTDACLAASVSNGRSKPD